MVNALKNFRLPYEWLYHFLWITVQVTSLSITIILIRKSKSNFQRYGFLIPEDFNGHLSLSLSLAFIYVIMTLFLPGNFTGFEAYPPNSTLYVFTRVMETLLVSTVNESVFRGYIQTNLMSYGFLKALWISSLMFAIYSLSSFLYLDAAITFYNLLFFLMEGIFLGILFKKTGTLICPISFYSTVSFLYYFTPLKLIAIEYIVILLKTAAYPILVPILYLLLRHRAKIFSYRKVAEVELYTVKNRNRQQLFIF
jgi:hypothetical protein